MMDSLKTRGCCKEKNLRIDGDNLDRIDSYFSGCSKLDTYDWLREVSDSDIPELVEVRFKNTRKGFYRNVNELRLKRGDIVAVEASPGHDIGIITLAGDIVEKQQSKALRQGGRDELRKVYRKAKEVDIEKWKMAIAKEEDTMLRSRQIAKDLGLNMKIGDVEYQGDNTKAIFYYIADERVDFRELIKVLAETFRIRIEMKQIGARQEAGRIGGIGTCGRELCCSTFVTNFVSVSTHSARIQEVALNPQKLAGQCGKLKCCLNYELAGYEDARKHFPDSGIPLKTSQGEAHHLKTDVYRGIMWYGFGGGAGQALVPVPAERVAEVQSMNRQGKVPDELIEIAITLRSEKLEYTNGAGQGSLTRFQKEKSRKKKRKKPTPKTQAQKVMKWHALKILLLLLIFAASCDQNVVYDEYVRTNGQWSWRDAKEFKVEMDDTLSLFNIYLQVRHTTEYPMSNLYMFVHVKGPTGEHRKDTVNMILAEPSGEWTGRGTGNLRELQLLFRKQVQFRRPGTYVFTLEQAMRNPELPVTDLGIRVERSNP
jgi:gliding motility-associated lipoprotein GldH